MSYYYICDGCGDVVTVTDQPIPEGEEWECYSCHSHALWEFTSKRNAELQSRRIMDGKRSRLFRTA